MKKRKCDIKKNIYMRCHCQKIKVCLSKICPILQNKTKKKLKIIRKKKITGNAVENVLKWRSNRHQSVYLRVSIQTVLHASTFLI